MDDKEIWTQDLPVSFDGGELGVVVVVAIISGSDEVLGHGVTQEDAEDAVLDGVGLVLVEGDEHRGGPRPVRRRGGDGLSFRRRCPG